MGGRRAVGDGSRERWLQSTPLSGRCIRTSGSRSSRTPLGKRELRMKRWIREEDRRRAGRVAVGSGRTGGPERSNVARRGKGVASSRSGSQEATQRNTTQTQRGWKSACVSVCGRRQTSDGQLFVQWAHGRPGGRWDARSGKRAEGDSFCGREGMRVERWLFRGPALEGAGHSGTVSPTAAQRCRCARPCSSLGRRTLSHSVPHIQPWSLEPLNACKPSGCHCRPLVGRCLLVCAPRYWWSRPAPHERALCGLTRALRCSAWRPQESGLTTAIQFHPIHSSAACPAQRARKEPSDMPACMLTCVRVATGPRKGEPSPSAAGPSSELFCGGHTTPAARPLAYPPRSLRARDASGMNNQAPPGRCCIPLSGARATAGQQDALLLSCCSRAAAVQPSKAIPLASSALPPILFHIPSAQPPLALATRALSNKVSSDQTRPSAGPKHHQPIILSLHTANTYPIVIISLTQAPEHLNLSMLPLSQEASHAFWAASPLSGSRVPPQKVSCVCGALLSLRHLCQCPLHGVDAGVRARVCVCERPFSPSLPPPTPYVCGNSCGRFRKKRAGTSPMNRAWARSDHSLTREPSLCPEPCKKTKAQCRRNPQPRKIGSQAGFSCRLVNGASYAGNLSPFE